jgi:pyruvate formate-lyase activating enzyme-like uncharacterized protein
VHSQEEVDDASPCPSDCSSCYYKEKNFENQKILKKLHEVKGDESIEALVQEMLEMSVLTPSKVPLIQ